MQSVHYTRTPVTTASFIARCLAWTVDIRWLILPCLIALASGVHSQEYPVKPIRFVVGLPPGGGTDLNARDIAARLTDRFKQPVLVDNRPGAGGSIAAEITARASADGYTLMMATGTYLIHPLMYPGRYDAARDFSPITQVVSLPLILVASAMLPVGNLQELIALARSKPGTIHYATPGIGSFAHLTGELFNAAAKIELVHVPYKGSATAYPDLVAGRVQLLFPAIASAMPHIKSGKLRPLAVTTRSRSKNAPDYPSMDEAGVKGFDVTQWYGVLAPAGTPTAIVALLQREIAALLKEPKFVAQLAAEGSDPVGSDPVRFRSFIESEIAKWGKVIKLAGIRGE